MTLELILGGRDPDVPVLQWWGYQRGDGKIILAVYLGKREMTRIAESHCYRVQYIRGPFLAVDRTAAMQTLKKKLRQASSDADRRIGRNLDKPVPPAPSGIVDDQPEPTAA